jgi:hypothetical protein
MGFQRFKFPRNKMDFYEAVLELNQDGTKSIVIQKYNLKLYIDSDRIGLCDARKIRYVHYEEVK